MAKIKQSSISLLKNGKLWFVIAILIALGFIFISVDQIRFKRHWHPEEENVSGSFRWMSQGAEIDVYAPVSMLASVNVPIWSYRKPRTLHVLFNGHEHSRYEILTEPRMIIILAKLRKGLNTFKFLSEDGCEYVWEKSNLLCRSFAISTIQMAAFDRVDLAEEAMLEFSKTAELVKFDEGWHQLEGSPDHLWRWMSKQATVLIAANKTGERRAKVKVWSFHRLRILRIFVENELVFEKEIRQQLTNISFPFKAQTGRNLVTFVSRDGCERPSDVQGSADNRCLSFAVSSIVLAK